jgi:amino acid adenylation domain-containing protein
VSVDLLINELAQQGVRLRIAQSGNLSVSAPRGEMDEALRRRIADHKPLLVEWLKRHPGEEVASTALPTIVADPEHWHDPFPLADLQSGFLLGEGEGLEFHVRAHMYFEKDFDAPEGFDVARFEQALNAALHQQRHNFPLLTSEGQLQVPRELHPLKIRVCDLRHLSVAAAETEMLKRRAGMSRSILPLDRWPTEEFRLSLYGGTRVRLHVNHNSFFGDGYGAGIFMHAVFDYYENPRPLPELTLSFRDCVLALQGLEESALGQSSRRYWESRVPHLPGPPPIPRVPGLETRSRSKLSSRTIRLSTPLWEQFKRRAYQVGITPSNALAAVYAELLSHWSGSRHFLLNNMVTHRFPMHPEVKDVFGNFSSLYPLEVDWREPGPFFKRAQQLQMRLLKDMRHLYYSGMKVLQLLNQTQHTLGRAPCPFVVASGLHLEGWEEVHYSCLETPQVLLDYQFFEVADRSLLVTWDVIEGFFPTGLIDAMQASFESLLTRLAQDEHAWSLASFDLLVPAQRNQRVLINATRATLPQDLLQSGLAASAALRPDKLAVIDTERRLSYRQLNTAANRLGHCLREAGAKPSQPIAILLDKGVEQAIAAFGILASGAAYVPIDPKWPAERIYYVLRNTDAQIVVTSRRQTLPPLSDGIRMVYVDESDLEKYPVTRLAVAQAPDDLAYIVFTSGSTGVSKGVMINHRGALNTVTDINRRFGIGEGDVILGISSLYFDLSVYDLFGATAAGATLVLPPDSDDPDPKGWIEAIHHHGVTVWNSVPALMQLLTDVAIVSGAKLPSLKVIMMSGDWIPVPLPAQIMQVAAHARVISLGGATEASIWSIYYPIEQVDPTWPSVPYGKPLANQTWHVLGENGDDAPTWVPGYLYIGGEGLALGYWKDEQKTSAAFTRHPRTGERLYKTGDLGRYLPDGNLEFLGRSDFQVKIQGYRVELGEIETVLSQHPSVKAVAVIASGTQAGKQLIAFVVPELSNAPSQFTVGEEFSDAALQAHLRNKLPRYMVPSRIVTLEQLPLTANGKVDRNVLAKLGPAEEKKDEGIAPRTDVERILVAIWEEVLGKKPIGARDDFFDLGGQSFAAVRMMTRIAQQFDRRLPLSTLLEDRTVEALANRLDKHETWSPLVPLRTKGEATPCFFVHPAGGNVLCYRGLAEKLCRPFYGLQAPGLSGEQPPLDNIEKMATLYRRTIQYAQSRGPYVLGGWSSGGTIAFEIARQLEAQGETIERIVMMDAPAPMQETPIDDVALLRWFLKDLGIDTARLSCDSPVESSIEQSLASMLQLVRAQQGLVRDIDTEQLQHVFAVFRRIVRAGRLYRPSTIYSDILVLRAQDGMVSEFSDHPALQQIDWGWKSFTHGRTDAALVPGTHYTIMHDGHLNALVEILERFSPRPPLRVGSAR